MEHKEQRPGCSPAEALPDSAIRRFERSKNIEKFEGVNPAADYLIKRYRVRPNLAVIVAEQAGLGGRS